MSLLKRKVCVVTGTRAEYGLLSLLMKGIQSEPQFELQIIVTGMHLSPEFGLTYKEIEKDGFIIHKKVEMLLSSDTENAITKSIGLATIGFADALEELNPDLLILLGDRYEILAAATAALIYKIPIAHLHGGERTEGLIDEAIRHSVTKMSHLHFVASEEYRTRVIQMGENPENVYNVGGLGVDAICNLNLLSKKELEKWMQFNFQNRSLSVTFHPVTLESNSAEKQFNELLLALEYYILNYKASVIFTKPNADTGGRVVIQLIDNFIKKHPDNAIAFKSMGHLRYLSLLQFVDGVIGNSSSGLLEAPTFKIGTINIGDRQKGRVIPDSLIQCEPDVQSIIQAIDMLYSSSFQLKLKEIVNPYGNGGASMKILEILKSYELCERLIKKNFFDWTIAK